MLKQIIARDFQGHHKSMIHLDPRVTCLIGASDVGKSALIRLAGWVAFNQPVGDWMIRHGQSKTIAKLVFDDCAVMRTKGKGRNTYALDGKNQKAFGAGKVPDLIEKALRLDPINFQWQMAGHFWFADTAGKVSQELNRVVDLSVIDSSLAAANADLKKAKATTEVCKDRLEAARKEAEGLDWVPAMARRLDRINTEARRLETAHETILALDTLLADIINAENRAKEASERADAALPLSERLKRRDGALAQQESLSALLDRITELDRIAHRPLPDLSRLEKRLLETNRLRAEGNTLEGVLDRLDDLEAEIWRLKNTATRAQRALEVATKGQCPICGKPM